MCAILLNCLPNCRRSILSLPPVDSRVVCVAFSLAEREFYDALYDKSQCVFDGFLKAGTASKSWFAIFSLLHRLRQTCDHVALTVQSRMKSDDLKTDESMGDKSASDCDTAQRCGVDDSTSAITGGDKHITDQVCRTHMGCFI